MKLQFSKLTFWDIALTKLSVLCSTLFLVSIWPQLRDFAVNTHWGWFLAAALILGIKPMLKVFRK